MISRIFYSDERIKNMEIIKRWYETVEYICKLYEENKYNALNEEIVCLGLFQCWSLITYQEDSLERYTIMPDRDFYTSKWMHFFLIALERFLDSPTVCWMAGYTASKHNVLYGGLFVQFGEKLMRRGLSLSSSEMPFDLFMGRKRKSANDLYYVRPELLFPSEIEADKYFRGLLDVVFASQENKSL